MKRRIFALLAALCLLAGCAGKTEPDAPVIDPAPPTVDPTPVTPTEPSEAEQAEARLRERIAGMSIEEKVGQMFFVRCPEMGAAEDVAAYHLGGLLLFGRDYKDADGGWLSAEELTAKLESYQAAAELPLFIGSDEEGGTVTRASRDPKLFAQPLPSPQELYAARGIQLLRRGQRLREELRVAARSRHRAALLVAADEERKLRRGLIALELRRQLLRAQPAAVCVLVVPSEEQQPPEVVGSYILRRAHFGTADKEHLPDLFLDRHPRDAFAQPRLSLLGLARLRRRDRRRVDRRRRGVNDRRVRLRFARAAREQAQRRKQRKNSSFHRVFPSFIRVLCASLCRVSRLFP